MSFFLQRNQGQLPGQEAVEVQQYSKQQPRVLQRLLHPECTLGSSASVLMAVTRAARAVRALCCGQTDFGHLACSLGGGSARLSKPSAISKACK